MSYTTVHIDQQKFLKKIIFALIAGTIFLLNFLIPAVKHVDHNLHIGPEVGTVSSYYNVK